MLERGEDAAGLLDLLEQRPRRLAELRGQRLDAAGARRGIGHLGEIGSPRAAPVACCAPRAGRTSSGRPSASVCGSTVIALAPPSPAAEGRHASRAACSHWDRAGSASARRSRALTNKGFGVEAAGLFDPRPQAGAARGISPCVRNWSASAQSRTRDAVARLVEIDAGGFQHAQIGKRQRPA